jgi:hypothetical protein
VLVLLVVRGCLMCDQHYVGNPTGNAEISSHTVILKVCQKIGASAISPGHLMFTLKNPLCASVPLLHVCNEPMLEDDSKIIEIEQHLVGCTESLWMTGHNYLQPY